MIYVIRSSAVVDESIPSFEFILKIGYCRDDREKVRTTAYLTENPTIKNSFYNTGRNRARWEKPTPPFSKVSSIWKWVVFL